MIGYVTLDEANEYIETHYVEDSAQRTAWEDLSDEDKQVLLLVSFEVLEQLPFTGRKTSVLQDKAFPRYPDTVVPQSVKASQIENAITLSDTSEAEEVAQYEKLWSAGVSSYSIGNLSESLGGASANSTHGGIASPKAKRLLLPYLSGGYCI